MNKEKTQEFTLRISRANKSQLVVILYDMLLTYLEDAQAAFASDDKKEYKGNIDKAKNCLDELLHSLNLEYPMAGDLQALYYFYKRELTTAAVRENPDLVVPVAAMLKELKDAYEKASAEDTSAPLMLNTQTVYAGLTYGRNSLNVNLADQNTNRGFCI